MNWLDQDSDILLAPTGLSFLGAKAPTSAQQQRQAAAVAVKQMRQQKVQAAQQDHAAAKAAADAAKAKRQQATAAAKTEKLNAAQVKKQQNLTAAVTKKINTEIAQIQRNIDAAKAKGIPVPQDWLMYQECLKLRLTDAAKTCQKPTGTWAQAIAKAKAAPDAASKDVAAIKNADSAEISKIQTMIGKLKSSMKNRVIALAKNPRTRTRATQLASKYCLTLGPNGEVGGEVCTPPILQAKAAQASAKGKAKRGMRGMGDEFDGTGNPDIEPFGPTIGGGGPIPTPATGDVGISPTTGDLGITTTTGGEDMDCGILLLALGGDAPVDPKCAKRPNKPACMMARMAEDQKKQFAVLILFLCEMINDLKTSITNVPVYDPNSQVNPNQIPYYDPSVDQGLVIGPGEGEIETGGTSSGAELVTGPMPDEAGDDFAVESRETFNEAWPMPTTPSELPPPTVPAAPITTPVKPANDEFGDATNDAFDVGSDFSGGAEEFGVVSDGFTDEGITEGSDVADGFDFGEGNSEAGLFGLACNGNKKCKKCN